MTASMDRCANGFTIYCHQIKIGDLFVLNKWSDIHMPEKLIEIFTTSILHLKFKVNNKKKNALAFGLVFVPADV